PIPRRPIAFDPRQEPGAGKPHAGICAGGEEQSSSLPRPLAGWLGPLFVWKTYETRAHLRSAFQIACEYVAAQATVLELGIRTPREIILGRCPSPMVGPVFGPCRERRAYRCKPCSRSGRPCDGRWLFKRR